MKKLSIILLLLMCAPVALLAQFSDPPPPDCDPLCNCRADGSICPVDNGVWLLLAIGLIYGIKKIIEARRSGIVHS